MNRLLLDALGCKNKSRPPVWFMRQAGRYLPEYREIRKKHSLIEMFHNSEVAAEITKQPIDILGVDAAILFADILLVAEAMGVGLKFVEGPGPVKGPVIDRPVRTAVDVKALPDSVDVRETLGYVKKTIDFLTPDLKVPLIGFCGGPFTVAGYMVEGKSSPDLAHFRKWMHADAATIHRLLAKVTKVTIDYLQMQIDAGVAALQIFESTGYVLSQAQFRKFALPWLKEIVDAVRPSGVPVILFARGSLLFGTQLAELNPAAISVDWNVDLLHLRNQLSSNCPNSKLALQGNIDPFALYGPQESIREEANRLLNQMKGHPGYIFNLGHGLQPGTPVDSVKLLVECVKSS